MALVTSVVRLAHRLPSTRTKVRAGRILAASAQWLGADPLVELTIDATFMRLDARCRSDGALVWNGRYDDVPWILNRLCDVYGDNFFDIGANVGRVAVPVGAHLKPRDGALVLIEPGTANRDRLLLNLALNGLESMSRVLGVALGASPGTATLSVESTLGSGTGNAMLGEGLPWRAAFTSEPVAVVRLDDLAVAHDLPCPDVVKIDVEGAEVGVLQGAAKVLGDARPVILGEFNSGLMPDFGHTFLDVQSTLPPEYVTFSFVARDRVIRAEPSVGLGDVLLVPQERVASLPFRQQT